MNLLGPTTFQDVLAEWGIHEAEGYIQAKHVASAPQLIRVAMKNLKGPNGKENAVSVIRWFREPVVKAIERANPLECFMAEIFVQDIDRIRVMGGVNPILS